MTTSEVNTRGWTEYSRLPAAERTTDENIEVARIHLICAADEALLYDAIRVYRAQVEQAAKQTHDLQHRCHLYAKCDRLSKMAQEVTEREQRHRAKAAECDEVEAARDPFRGE